MIKVFLSSHGGMAGGMQGSLNILLGGSENLTVFDAYLDESSVQEHLDSFYQNVQEDDEVLLCSDLLGGSVNQAMCLYLDRPHTRLVTGINLPFLISVMSEETLDDARLSEIIEESRQYLCRVEMEETEEKTKGTEEDFF